MIRNSLTFIIAAGAAIIVLAGIFYLRTPQTPPPDVPDDGAIASADDITVVAENLSIPWEIVFLPNGDMLVTERPGTLKRIGKNRQTYEIAGVAHRGEGGLLGAALHPRFSENRWLYLYLTTRAGSDILNRVDRYTLADDALTDRTEIIGGIPGAAIHDGGRVAFGPDNFLYITTGDAGSSRRAQDTASLAGKILHVRATTKS